MHLELEQHDEIVFLLPLLGMSYGDCTNPYCKEPHWRISVGWFVWSCHLIF